MCRCGTGGGGVKRGEFRATARAVGPTRHWCVSGTPPEAPTAAASPARYPHPRNRCGRVAAPRNETAARASTSRQALRTSSCFPVAQLISVTRRGRQSSLVVRVVVVVTSYCAAATASSPPRKRYIIIIISHADDNNSVANFWYFSFLLFRRSNFARSPIVILTF